MKKKWLKAKVTFHFYRGGNCYYLWSLPYTTRRWYDELFSISWWRLQITLDRRTDVWGDIAFGDANRGRTNER